MQIKSIKCTNKLLTINVNINKSPTCIGFYKKKTASKTFLMLFNLSIFV